MSNGAASFRRYLSEPFLEALEKLIDRPEGQWWRDVLAHPDLFLAVRSDSLGAYYRGALIFNVLADGDGVVPETHFKYLLRQRQAYVSLGADGDFQFDPSNSMWTRYEPQITLKEMMQAANAYAGVEKTGLHALIIASDNVIDVEASFSRSEPETAEPDGAVADAPIDDFLGENSESSPAKASRRLDRIDAVSLESRDDGIWLVFHEAKHFSNKELRASAGRQPAVVEQIDRYRKIIRQYESDILKSYADVCRALVRIDAMKRRLGGQKESAAPQFGKAWIAEAAKGVPFKIDPDPRLIIYGFDQAQRDNEVWREHNDRLREALGVEKVYAIGDPRKAGPTAFLPRIKR